MNHEYTVPTLLLPQQPAYNIPDTTRNPWALYDVYSARTLVELKQSHSVQEYNVLKRELPENRENISGGDGNPKGKPTLSLKLWIAWQFSL